MNRPKFFVEIYKHTSFDVLPKEKQDILSQQIQLAEEWFEKYTPLDVRFVITPFSDALSVRYLFTNYNNSFGPHFWGVKGLDILRKYVKPNYYHAAVLMYNLQEIPGWTNATQQGGQVQNYAWIAPSEWVNGTPSIELSFSPYNLDDCARKLTHELIHVAHALAKKAGIKTNDTMDWYDNENEMNLEKAPNGNRARNLRELEQHWGKIAAVPESRGLIAWVINLLKVFGVDPSDSFGNEYDEEFPMPETPPLPNPVPVRPQGEYLRKWAEAIKRHEGWFAGSRSQRNNNPGNLKFTPYVRSLGATKKDSGGFAIFPTYGDGWNALVNFLKDAAENKLIPYKGNPTLQEFFRTYAPSSDNNDPDHYAKVVAEYIGVPVSTPIASLLK